MSLICAFLVVCIHYQPIGDGAGTVAWWVRMLFNRGICTLAVPFFFCVSGYLLARHCGEAHWWKREVFKRIKSLVIPYFLWGMLFFLYTIPIILAGNLLAGRPLSGNLPDSGADMLHILGLHPGRHPYLPPLWFIRGLFVFVCLSPAAVWIMRKGRMARVLLLAALAAAFIFKDRLNADGMMWALSHAVWFVAGMLFAVYAPDRRPDRRLVPFTGVLALVLLILRGFAGLYGWSCENTLALLAIPFMLCFCWNLLSDTPWRASLTRAAFPVFLMHMFFLALLRAVCSRLPFVEAFPVVVPLVACVIAFAASCFASAFLHRHFPRTASLFFGGR